MTPRAIAAAPSVLTAPALAARAGCALSLKMTATGVDALPIANATIATPSANAATMSPILSVDRGPSPFCPVRGEGTVPSHVGPAGPAGEA